MMDHLKNKIARISKETAPFRKERNAQCHKSMKTMAELNELDNELLPYPPYSPDRPQRLFPIRRPEEKPDFLVGKKLRPLKTI